MTDILTMQDFSAALHAESDPSLLPDGSCQDCANLVFHRGTVRVRPGRVRHARFEPLDGSLRALAEYQDPTDTLGAARLVAAVGTGLFASQLPDQTKFQLIKTGVLHPSNRPRMQQFNDWLYIVDGEGLVRRWKPGAWETLEELEDLLKPTVAPVVSLDIMRAEVGNGRLFDSDVVGQTAVTFSDWGPRLISRIMWYCSVFGGNGADLWQGCARKFTDAGNIYAPHAESVGLEILAKHGGISDGVAHFEQLLTRSLDLSAAETLMIRYKLHYDPNYGKMLGVKFGFKEWDSDEWHEFDMPCDLAPEEWHETPIDLSDVPANQRDAVRYLRIRVPSLSGPTCAVARRDNKPGIYGYPAAEYALTIVVDGIYVDSIDATQRVTQGTYEFTYSYDWDAEGDDEELESGPYRNANPPPEYTELVVSDDLTFGFSIICTKDADIDASHINVYARGGEAEDPWRIGRLALNGETLYTLQWDGRYSSVQTPRVILREYVEVPPAGCSLLVEWKGRMVYAKGDKIYISNWDNPVRTPLSPMVEKPMHYGGWYRVGADGSAVVGMGPLGSYMLVMKENATVWRLEGEGGDAFTLLQIAKGVDCLSHETIEQVGGNALAWLGKDTVTAWDGQEFRALGAPPDPRLAHISPIGNLLKAHREDYGREVMEDAFAVYDPETHRYCLTLPMTLPFIWVPNLDGTVSKINTKTGAEVGRYHVSRPDHQDIGASPTGAVRSANVVTITTAAPHPFVFGSDTTITIEGVVSVGATDFNGVFTIVSVPDDTHFTYAQTAADDTGGAGECHIRPSPSRTTVDLYGNCWVGNRQRGTVVKIGLLESSMWEDRNEDGICQTSRDLDGDGVIGEDEILPWGEDECVLQEVVLVAGQEGVYVPGEYSGPYDYLYWGTAPRGIAVDNNNNAWVGTWDTQKYYELDGITGAILQTVVVSGQGHKAYGAVIDRNGILWSSSLHLNHVLRMDTNATPPDLSKVSFDLGCYGLGLDRLDHLFVTHNVANSLSRVNITTAAIEWTKACGGGLTTPKGVCAGADTDIWIAFQGSNKVGRYDVDGNLKASIPVGLLPTGVARDRAGRIWACDQGDDYVHRIDPGTNAIDLSKEIAGSLGHYTYSDMTGVVVEDMTGRPAPQGEPNALSFVFEMETGGWTRWLTQPGGCALYSYRARLPGVYAGTRLVLGQYVDILRLMVGHTDATVESLAQAIAWYWHSQEFTKPGEGIYKDLDRVILTAGLQEPVSGVVAAIRANGNSADNAMRSLSVHAAPGEIGDALWRPPLIPDMVSFSLRLAGESSDADEILRVKVYVQQRGRA